MVNGVNLCEGLEYCEAAVREMCVEKQNVELF